MDRPPHLDIDLNAPPPPSPPLSPAPADIQSPPREFAAAIPVVGPPPPPPPPPPQLPPAANVQGHLLLPHQARELALAYHRAESWRLAAATASAPATAGSSVEVPPPSVLHSPTFAPPPQPPQLPPLANVHLMRPPPIPSPLPAPGVGVRGPPAAVNEDWMCPEYAIGAVNAPDITRQVSVADGAHLTELATPHFEGMPFNHTTPFGQIKHAAEEIFHKHQHCPSFLRSTSLEVPALLWSHHNFRKQQPRVLQKKEIHQSLQNLLRKIATINHIIATRVSHYLFQILYLHPVSILDVIVSYLYTLCFFILQFFYPTFTLALILITLIRCVVTLGWPACSISRFLHN
ncbi:uncharacterized protein [Aegilops tauschii subsp. strangulata]|uniref:uncharacterized protein isoform X2 n=1 Tax=Aegilops tauschii subsp. strangulata TaxID=200361 RepID=UPI003CC8A593